MVDKWGKREVNKEENTQKTGISRVSDGINEIELKYIITI